MNNNQTIEKLREMRLTAMSELHLQHVKNNSFNELTPDEYLAILTDHEWEDRQNRKTGRLLKQAGFRQKASVADINYAEPRNLEKNMFHRLATLDFIVKNRTSSSTELLAAENHTSRRPSATRPA